MLGLETRDKMTGRDMTVQIQVSEEMSQRRRSISILFHSRLQDLDLSCRKQILIERQKTVRADKQWKNYLEKWRISPYWMYSVEDYYGYLNLKPGTEPVI